MNAPPLAQCSIRLASSRKIFRSRSLASLRRGATSRPATCTLIIRPASLHSLSKQTWILLILSSLTVVVSWIVYIRRERHLVAKIKLSIDQLNSGFAILFALTLFGAEPTSQSAWGALAIVAGSILLGRRRIPQLTSLLPLNDEIVTCLERIGACTVRVTLQQSSRNRQWLSAVPQSG